MRALFICIFLLSFSFLAKSQNFRYLKPDTMPYDIICLKLEGEEGWSKPLDVEWSWRNDSELIKYIEESVFKVAFHGVDWKQIPALLKIGVFFRFDKTYHIDYIHFAIHRKKFSREELIPLEKNFLDYIDKIKKIDLKSYLYIAEPEKFEYGIGRIWLITKNSSVWNEK